jgi:hypothetical protein
MQQRPVQHQVCSIGGGIHRQQRIRRMRPQVAFAARCIRSGCIGRMRSVSAPEGWWYLVLRGRDERKGPAKMARVDPVTSFGRGNDARAKGQQGTKRYQLASWMGHPTPRGTRTLNDWFSE